MNKIIYGDFGKNRCRNSESEKSYNAPVVSLTEPELEFDKIALSDRILDLMADPNLGTNRNKNQPFWFDFWEEHIDLWNEIISVDPMVDITDLDRQKLMYRVSVLFEFLRALQASAEAQALEDQAEREYNDDH